MPALAKVRACTAFVVLGLTVSGCSDDDPSGPSADFDVVGQWQWRVSNASGSGVTCTVTGVTLTFSRSNGVLTGTRFSNGGGNVACTSGGSSTTGNFTTDTGIQQLVHTDTSISFQFDTSLGAWVMTGSITGANSMGGSATIRLNSPSGSIVALTGPWTATRD